MRFADLDGDPRRRSSPPWTAIRGLRARGAAGITSVAARAPLRTLGTQLASGDPDRDGDQDVYVAARTGSTLLRNHGGPPAPERPRALRPSRARRWRRPGPTTTTMASSTCTRSPAASSARAMASGSPAVGSFTTVSEPGEARLAWPDLDGDGFREPVISARPRRSARRLRTFAFPNGGTREPLARARPRGHARNRQAIGAPGAGPLGRRRPDPVGRQRTRRRSTRRATTASTSGSATRRARRSRCAGPSGRVEDSGSVAADQLLAAERVGAYSQ